MPQMMPMMWLFIFFTSLIFLMFLIQHLYFFYSPKIKNNSMMMNSPKYLWNWKW